MLIRFQNVTRTYYKGSLAVEALRKADLQIEKGESVSIMGPSGSGKSTLMHILGCLDQPTSGFYLLDGKRVDQLSDKELSRVRNRKIGFIFQAYNLLPQVNVLHNVELGLIYGNYPAGERMAKSLEVIRAVGLEKRINHYPSELSGGEMQRVAIARALATDPMLLLADEPTGNLDSKMGREIMEIFREINSRGKTVIVVTHEQDVAEHSQRIIYIRDGAIVNEGGK